MKVAMSWFNEFVDMSGITPKEYADALTMSGTMVEERSRWARKLKRL